MIFTETPLKGAMVIDIEPRADERGVFARTFCEEEFREHGLPGAFRQCNLSINNKRGLLRGMHYQADPHPEAKLVRCVRGAIHDVIVDLRPKSPTYCQWFGADLTAENSRALYVPEGFAHGFVTLKDDSEVLYYMSETYYPDLARAVRWNDPAFGIDWPLKDPVLNERDANCPDYQK